MVKIIQSILDTDLYKLTMQHAVMMKYPSLRVKYKFTDRTNRKYPKGFAKKLMDAVKLMELLQLTDQEATYLEKLKLFPPTYIDFLRGFKFDSSELDISQNEDDTLNIMITGYWYRTILWEVPLMALISELFFITSGQIISQEELLRRRAIDAAKFDKLASHNAFFADFGTRRRYSFENQRRIVELFNSMDKPVFVGTSNVYLAMMFGLKATGTMAHEWIMVHACIYGYKMANKMSLDHWVDVYDGDLGIALSDTFTTDVFFKTFDKKLAKLFDGVRHDSGDPWKFADKVISHYVSLGIDPMSKTIIFSDALDPVKAAVIKEYCVGKIKTSFGIGTNFTNDLGFKALNIVIKIFEVEIDGEWVPAIKLSDDIGKHTGNPEEVEVSLKVLNLK